MSVGIKHGSIPLKCITTWFKLEILEIQFLIKIGIYIDDVWFLLYTLLC